MKVNFHFDRANQFQASLIIAFIIALGNGIVFFVFFQIICYSSGFVV